MNLLRFAEVVMGVKQEERQYLFMDYRVQRGQCVEERESRMDRHKGTIGLAETQHESSRSSVGILSSVRQISLSLFSMSL